MPPPFHDAPRRPCPPAVGRLRPRPLLACLVTVFLIQSAAPAEPPVELPRYLIEAASDNSDPAAAILPADAWGGRPIATLGDAIGHAPGLLLQESFGGFEPPRLSIRGSGLQSAPSSRGLALELDGLPLNLADGSFNSALFAPQIAGGLTVNRGLEAWRSDPAVLGGSLNLIPSPEPPDEIRAEAGSFGAARIFAGAGVSAGRNRIQADASFDRQDGYRAHSAQERPLFFGQWLQPASDTGATSVSVMYVRPEYDVPGPLTLAAAESSPASISSDVRRDQPRREAELARLAVTHWGQAAGLRYDLGLAFSRTDDWFRQLQANGISDSKSDDLSLHAGATDTFAVAELPNQLRTTLAATGGWRELQRFTNVSGATGSRFGDDGLYATTATIGVDDTIQLTRTLEATAGWARLAGSRCIVDRMPTANSNTGLNLSQGANLGAAGLQWSAFPGITAFARWTQTAEPPTFDDLVAVSGSFPNLVRRSQPLQTQRAATWELGAAGRTGELDWTLTVYDARWHDEILRLADAQGLPRGAVNAGITRHRGLEAELHWRICDRGSRLTLNTGANACRCTFDDDPVFGYNRLAGLPLWEGFAELQYEHPSGLTATAGVDWTAGRTLADHAGRLGFGGCPLYRVGLSQRIGSRGRIYLEVRNLFDRRHIASTAGVLDIARNPAATAVFLPGNGRMFSVGFEWKP